MKTILDRFRSKYRETSNGCWVWFGSTNGVGYGEIRIKGKKVYAHRWSFEFFKKVSISTGMQIDHLCRNRSCVNPDHLEAVTAIENVRRGEACGPKPERMATHCSKGHLYSTNTYLRPDGRGRNCVQCVRNRSREYQRKKRASCVS